LIGIRCKEFLVLQSTQYIVQYAKKKTLSCNSIQIQIENLSGISKSIVKHSRHGFEVLQTPLGTLLGAPGAIQYYNKWCHMVELIITTSIEMTFSNSEYNNIAIEF
jgi:hypothetical protein